MNKRLLTLAADRIAGTVIGGEWADLAAIMQTCKDEHIAAASCAYSDQYRTRHERIAADCDLWLAAAKALDNSDKPNANREPCPGCLKMARCFMVEVLESSNADTKAWNKAEVVEWQKRSLTCAGKMGNHATHDGGIDDAVKDGSYVCDDAPIADPVECAKATAQELRNRGMCATPQGQYGISVVSANTFWYHMAHEGVATMGPRALADRIQASEAKRAREWAGDK